MNDVGIMQGRLSPPVPDRLQAFPWSTWEKEFEHAKACGFDTIEWLFEAERYEQNPIWTASGVQEVNRLIASTAIRVQSVCADYFMIHPFFRVSEAERLKSVTTLCSLIERSATIGVRLILLPVLEVSEVRTEGEKHQLLDSLREPLALARMHDIRLGLETELKAPECRALIEECDHSALGVYYDVGNATAKGYDIASDIRFVGPLLYGVHIKDRKRGGPSVLLGQGETDFEAFFKALAEIHYTGQLVLQTAFGQDYLTIARSHLAMVRRLTSKYARTAPPFEYQLT